MTNTDLKAKLERFLELLLEEREAAKALDMAGLQQIVAAKEMMLEGLKPRPEDVVGMEDLLRRIDEENRRNAFLLWTGLNWVRDLMGFFGKAAMPQVYGGRGQSQTLTQGGRLLSGRI